MSEMIERGARALAAKHYAKRFNRPADDPNVVGNVHANWNIFADDARTVIEAMREPTQEMCMAADALDEVSKGVLITPIPYRAWEAMIDEALK